MFLTPPNISEPFEEKECIGEGVYGRVFRVEDSIGNVFAFKVPKSGDFSELKYECDRCQWLIHPNIARVWGEGKLACAHTDGAITGIASEYVPGRHLAEILRANRNGLSIERTLIIAGGVASALEFAHNPPNGVDPILHRDLAAC